MSFFPLIGAAAASAITTGLAVKIIKDNKTKKIVCGEDTVFLKGKCTHCEGGSGTKFSGEETNIIGCRCPDNLGWDSVNKRCVHCPDNLYTNDMTATGTGGSVKGCKCPTKLKYDSTTKSCVSCPAGLIGDGYFKNPAGDSGCFCGDSYHIWNSTTKVCEKCFNKKGTKGNKNGLCVNCPSYSSNYYIKGDETDVYNCRCVNGYTFTNGKCVACPSDYVSDNGKCCPAGSSQYGNGDKVIEGCYCLPYHTLKNGKCDISIPLTQINTVYNFANYPTSTSVPTLTNTIAEIGISPSVAATGKSGIELITFATSISDVIFIKNVKIEYVLTSTDTIVKNILLPNTRDVYVDFEFISSIQSGDFVDPSWIIKRITVSTICGISKFHYEVPSVTIRMLGGYNDANDTFALDRSFNINIVSNAEMMITGLAKYSMVAIELVA